jgi:nucleoside-diphosphate-sugar epimerase
MKEHVLVTGAKGFLGRHLTSQIEGCTPIPHEDIGIVSFSDYDRFYFLSTYGNMYSHTDTAETVKANVTDLVNVLRQTDFDHGQPFKSFVFISSSSVRLKRQTTYSRAKKAAEEILLAYMEKYNAPICIVRPFSITGVGEQPEHLIPTLIRSCMTGEPMDFVQNPVHDFIDVSDVVAGMLNLSQHGAKGIFELGTGKAYTNQQVREIVERVTGKKANVNVVPQLRDYDNQDWSSMNYRARMYGWLPKKSLEQSITEMVEAYKK